MFRAAKQNRIFQDVVEQIQEAIFSGRLKAGEQLPAERELKEQFGVSRGTLREALRVLEQKGLIQIKTGVAGGSIVREVSAEQMGEGLALLIRYRKVALPQLAEFREGIEGNVAALAAERATAGDIKRLRDLLDRAGEQLERGVAGWDDFIRVDEELHRTLAEITGNSLYIVVLSTVSENIHTYYESYLARDEVILRENYADLQALVAAVDKRETDQARLLAQEHVRRFSAHMEGR